MEASCVSDWLSASIIMVMMAYRIETLVGTSPPWPYSFGHPLLSPRWGMDLGVRLLCPGKKKKALGECRVGC